jgi:hypothetical protein
MFMCLLTQVPHGVQLLELGQATGGLSPCPSDDPVEVCPGGVPCYDVGLIALAAAVCWTDLHVGQVAGCMDHRVCR